MPAPATRHRQPATNGAPPLRGKPPFRVQSTRRVLQWQRGHGVVSFGTKDLPWVQEYLRNQRQHHALGTCHERLERITILELTSKSQDRDEDEMGS